MRGSAGADDRCPSGADDARRAEHDTTSSI